MSSDFIPVCRLYPPPGCHLVFHISIQMALFGGPFANTLAELASQELFVM